MELNIYNKKNILGINTSQNEWILPLFYARCTYKWQLSFQWANNQLESEYLFQLMLGYQKSKLKEQIDQFGDTNMKWFHSDWFLQFRNWSHPKKRKLWIESIHRSAKQTLKRSFLKWFKRSDQYHFLKKDLRSDQIKIILLVGARQLLYSVSCLLFSLLNFVSLYIGGKGEVKFSVRTRLSRYLKCPLILLKSV
jgi:hypothetical protein